MNEFDFDDFPAEPVVKKDPREYTHNSAMRNGSREPCLWIALRGELHTFLGQDIGGVCRIMSEDRKKAGKWSGTTYQLRLAKEAKPCFLLANLHQSTWPENDRRNAYNRFLKEFQLADVGFDTFSAALERDYPQSYVRMIRSEEVAKSLD